MNKFARDYRHAADKFQFVLELSDLYRSEHLYNNGLKSLRQIVETEPSPDDSARLRLGLVFMKRTRSKDLASDLFDELNSIQREIQECSELRYSVRLVRGALFLMKSRDYQSARAELRPLHEELRSTEHHFLFGVTSKLLATAYMILGESNRSEESFQYALTTFRRYQNKILHALTLNDYAVLKKRLCAYDEASSLLNRALKASERVGITSVRVSAFNNLGIVNMKTGDWVAARLYFEKARSCLADLVGEQNESQETVRRSCEINAEHLMVLSRNFTLAEKRLHKLLIRYGNGPETRRMRALVHEFLGEIYTELGRHREAETHLNQSVAIASEACSVGDVMTESKSRSSYLHLRKGDHCRAKQEALECIKLSIKNGDLHERGVALRILGESYAITKKWGKAVSCFQTSIKLLRNIHECYELMRTCLAYGSFLTTRSRHEAEMYLSEAQQLGKQLESKYFLARIYIAYTKMDISAGNYTSARDRLSNAEEICREIHGYDENQIEKSVSIIKKELESKILERCTSGAEELRLIGRIYEEARFPLDDLKPDLAYKVAQSIGADSLFLVKRRGKGYDVRLTYNIPVNEAKEMVRRADRDRKRPMLGVVKDPKVMELYTGHHLICIPSINDSGFVLCAHIASVHDVTPRQFEFLIASADVIERLAVNNDEAQMIVSDDFSVAEGKAAATHPRGSFKDILTVSQDMIRLIRLAERVSVTQETILLEGETGVGKELFANAIHENSGRKHESIVAVNAGGMPVSLLESQLFGHVKGAFTDAVRDRAGLIEEANGGTVFLDEVGEMGPELQVKLLRLLENGEYRRLGENQVRMANVRVVSATNRVLLDEVERGNFRRDLYYRLGTVKLQIPPLRFRQRDIELLIRHFLRQCASRHDHIDRYFEIDVKAMEALERYDWPGNVRELQNEIRRIVSLIGDGNVIRFGMLSQHIKDYLKSRHRSDGLLERSVDRYERRMILEALTKNDWNRLRTAEELGVPRTTLLAKMRRLNVAAR